MDNNFYFECDFYYLYYSLDESQKSKNGTIFRHYLNNNFIEFINGSDEQNPQILNDPKIKKNILNNLKIFKSLMINSVDLIEKSSHPYLNIYDFSNTNYDNYYKKISIAHLEEPNNICNTFYIDFNSNINIGMVFRFIKTSMFDIDNVKIKYKKVNCEICNNDDFIKTDIIFSTYRECFHDDTYNIDCIKTKFTGGTYKPITKIKTEQHYIKHDTIMYYYKNLETNIKPVTIEYDYDSESYFIIDGNHRVAYHILRNYEYIPVIIIFKKIEMLLPKETKKPTTKRSPRSPIITRSSKISKTSL